MSNHTPGPEAEALAAALRHLPYGDGMTYHGHVLGAALPQIAAAIVEHLTARGWTPPAQPGDDIDQIHIGRQGITTGGIPLPAPVDRSAPVTIRSHDEHATLDVRLIAIAGIEADPDTTTAETGKDGTVTVRWRESQ